MSKSTPGFLTDNEESVHPAPGRSPTRPAEARNGTPDVRIRPSLSGVTAAWPALREQGTQAVLGDADHHHDPE